MEIAKLSIIIPTYNEGRTIQTLLEKVTAVNLLNGISKEIIIVNDCSTDNTEEIIEGYMGANPYYNIQYFKQEKNQGKGAAIHIGITNAKGEYLIIQDADLEYDPQDYNSLLIPIMNKTADIVYGSRLMKSNSHQKFAFWQLLGNKVLTSFSNIFTRLNLTDMETCYKLIRTELIQQIDLQEKRFGFEPEITCKITRIKNIRVCEVPISYFGRTYRDGKKINWKDGVRSIYCILKYGMIKR